ncbi:transcription factor Jun-like [Oratosquilla oratoria]|uniref:transcription factor Jun-like n=1 Tax=Oratosquilla oratoria TaxID=337810 RepID=UPI003F75BB78
METTMYEDGSYNGFPGGRGESVAQMKRKLTLDLNRPPPKKQRLGGAFNPLLTSPDLNMLKLASPELERLIIQQGTGLNTGNTPAPSQFFFPKTVTEEQEEFAKGFEDTLQQMHQGTSVQGAAPLQPVSVTVTSDNNSGTYHVYTQLDSTHQQQQQQHHQVPVTSGVSIVSTTAASRGVTLVDEVSGGVGTAPMGIHIKEEPQTVPSVCGSPPMSPINMESQERIKLERKRLRNRIAASKCRRRKLERISRLEDKVSSLKGENVELQAMVNKLRDQVCQLKQEVMDHVNSGCQIPFVTQQ